MAERDEVLAERFRLIEPLGQGGMATVWRAEHVELGSAVAIKLINRSVAATERGLARFRREAKAAAALTSAHVVQIFDYGVHDDEPYIAMELLEGESLAQRLATQGTLSPVLTARVVTHVARAIHKAHEVGIVHRDLKPDNVFITRDDDGEPHIKVLDFGVAKALDSEVLANVPSHTSTGALVGSPFYMSPEQIRGHKDIDHRADLWSLGVIAYECLTGKRPFTGESLGDLVMAVCSDPMPVPPTAGSELEGFDEWFAKACARKPEYRFQSARAMAAAFRQLLSEAIVEEDSQDTLVASGDPPAAGQAAAAATAPGLAGAPNPDEDQRTPISRLAKVAALGLAVGAVLVIAIVTWLPLRSPAGSSGTPSTATREDGPPAPIDAGRASPGQLSPPTDVGGVPSADLDGGSDAGAEGR